MKKSILHLVIILIINNSVHASESSDYDIAHEFINCSARQEMQGRMMRIISDMGIIDFSPKAIEANDIIFKFYRYVAAKETNIDWAAREYDKRANELRESVDLNNPLKLLDDGAKELEACSIMLRERRPQRYRQLEAIMKDKGL